MGSSRALLWSTAFVLVLLSSASKDEHMFEQREVTFDLDKIMQEMQQPDQFMLQSELDLSDLLDPKEFPIEQERVSPPEQHDILRERGNSRPGILKPRGRQPVAGPRTFGGPPMLNYRVQFPLARPTSDNLQAICLNGDRRPRYPDSYFPRSGFGQQKRRASAVNRAESWFSTCCKRNQTWERDVMLCCATQAWELSVETFCAEDSAVKDRLYECCRLTGSDRLQCFNNDAPNPNYEATEEVPMPELPSDAFNFDPNTCQRTVMTPYSVRANRRKKMKKPSASLKVNMNFPPGRPTEHVIKLMCQNQKLRPLYNVKCLPSSGYELVARQAKTINRIEKGFKQCCKQKRNILKCADQKWRDEVDKFCLADNGGQVDFDCCSAGAEANDRYSCFQSLSPDPHFNVTSATEELSLHNICDTHKIIKKKFPVGFPLKSFVQQCCPLEDQEKSTCFDQRLKELSGSLCSSKKPTPPAVRRCCRKPSSQDAPDCVSDILTEAITKATNVLRQKKRKRCPLS
ncbi:extracellular matrix protein 1-like [Cheilinus undulatus]|uniref:extracellular matrix protein 1-like n=1 Tax=Cheilinus undulatus TaxID=241271 RepID=UPI001BD31B69|nr:extracellular matrix protein 1-like [Cheilinus undulatus]